MGHIPTKLHQLLMSSFQDFVWTDRQTDRHRQKQYLLAACVQVITHNVQGTKRPSAELQAETESANANTTHSYDHLTP